MVWLEMSVVKHVTVLLPEGKQFADTERAIEAAAKEAGADVSRPEVEFSSHQRLGTACAEIEKTDLVVAEISAGNPNTMYLAGYAQGIGKRVVFLALHGEGFPFDRERHQSVIYSGDVKYLQTELEGIFRGGKSEQSKGALPSSPREQFDQLFGEIMKKHGQEHAGAIEMENEKTFILRDQNLELPLVQELARKARELGMRIKLM